MARTNIFETSAPSQHDELHQPNTKSYSDKRLPGIKTLTSPDFHLRYKHHDHSKTSHKSIKTPTRTKKPPKPEKKPKYLIKREPFSRLVREIGQNFSASGFIKFRSAAIDALQEVAEDLLVKEFTMFRQIAHHAKRKTIKPEDAKLVQKLKAIMEGREVHDGDDGIE